MDLGLAIDFSRGRNSSGSEPAPLGRVRSGSAAVCSGLKCLLWVVIVSRPDPDTRFFFVLRKRFLNLGGRGRAADQTLASETLVSQKERALSRFGIDRISTADKPLVNR